jgi:PAS domain S-box-containing protein
MDCQRALEALQLSEEKFRQLAENISEVFWITDPAKNQVIYISPAYEPIWGRTCASLMQSPQAWQEAIHPADRPRVAEAAQRKRTSGEYDEIYRIIRPDGSVRWIHDRAFPLRTARGEIYRLVGIAADITEFKRIQEELSGREEQYRQVFAAVTEGLVVREWDGTIVEVNPAFCRIVGYSRDEILGLQSDGFIAPEFRPLFRSKTEKVRNGSVVRFEGQLQRKDGSAAPVDVSGAMVHYHGRPHLLCAIHDITARKLAEEALRKSEAEFRITFENAPIGMALVGPDGRPIRCNRAVQQLLGYSEKELQGLCFSEFTHPDDVQADLELFRELLEGKREYYQMEKRYLPKGGGLVSARLTVSMGRGPAGKAQYAIAMVEDITEKRKIEQQFLRAQRMESIGHLAGGIVHDLNNVLSPILLSVQLLQVESSPARRQALLATLEATAQRGAGIVRRVLLFARGAEGDRVELDPKHLLQEIERIIGETFPRTIAIKTEVAADCSSVLGDFTQLQQVLLNLCVNSRDAMPEGGRLTIAASNVMVDEHFAGMNPGARLGPHVVLQVTDTGSGIPQGIIDRIFDPFFTTKEAGKGTGLGLSTLLAIVKGHGGFVQVYSEPKLGTTFKIHLPSSRHPAVEARSSLPLELPRGKGELVLIVDDEESICHVTKNTLEAFGYRVLVAQDGAEAVALFAQHRDDVALVLTDMMMPVMDGPSAILAISHIRPEIKVIATSGFSSMRELAREVPATAKHHLQKPYTADKLLQTVRQALHG